MPTVIEDISLDNFKSLLDNNKPEKRIILRFTADWCGPCKGIDSICEEYFSKCSDNIQPVVVDVDETMDLYMIFKRYRRLNGIPALFAFYGNNMQNPWYISNDSVNTGDKQQVMNFFNRCTMHINNLKK